MKFPTTGLALISVCVAACGGGDSETMAGIDGRGSPTPAAIVSKGTITAFGSVVVNGVRYDTNGATFEIDGKTGSQDDLSVGDVIVVKGTLDDNGSDGSATSVVFDDLVEGPVSAVDKTAGALTVLGQTVRVDADTSFDDSLSPASIDGVNVGQVIEVSGFRRADGTIAATRIEAKPAGEEFEVTGEVSNLSGTRFELHGLTVDFSAAQLDNFPGGAPENGQLVEAKGNSLGAGGELLATRVEFKGSDLGAENGDQAEVEGFITRFESATDFDVADFAVTTTGNTVFEGGSASDLGLNVKVEAEGTIDANGVLVADKIDIRKANQVRVTAVVDSVDTGANSLVVLGISFSVDSATRIEDKSDADLRPLTLANINSGDYVEIRGDESPSGNAIHASILERENLDDETILQGFVESISNPSYSLLGVSVSTNAGTVFRDAEDAVISATEFFNRLDTGDLVKAKGVESSTTTISAEEVEFESAL